MQRADSKRPELMLGKQFRKSLLPQLLFGELFGLIFLVALELVFGHTEGGLEQFARICGQIATGIRLAGGVGRVAVGCRVGLVGEDGRHLGRLCQLRATGQGSLRAKLVERADLRLRPDRC